jgi:hypothetical protein
MNLFSVGVIRLAKVLPPLIAALACTSCGGADRKPVYPVKGQVNFEGRPLPSAFVVFHPLGGPDVDSIRPVGQGDRAGSFNLTTYTRHDGAPAGEYAVTVEFRPPPLDGDAPHDDILPARYAKPESSGLRVQVIEGDNELPPFELKWQRK